MKIGIVTAFGVFLLALSDCLETEQSELWREERQSDSKNTVCYDYLGCFSNDAPFDNAANVLPQSPDYINTTFMLYDQQHSNDHDFDILSYTNDSFETNSSFDASRMTRVIVHGFSNSGFKPWVQTMKDAFLQMEDSNVIIVDWGKGAAMPMYQNAVANTRLVGRQLRLLLQKLMSEAGLELQKVHLIGHSLGAHTSGYCGRELEGHLYRITAMDPAGPLFDHFKRMLDLDRTDARFVDVIHSNGKPLLNGGAGLFKQVGHVDFYLNGGKTQPGCSDGFSALTTIFSQNIGDAVSCSHERSHAVFIESITSDCPFTAYPCDNFDDFKAGRCLECGRKGCSELGLYADQHEARGKMFLKTRSQSPYCGFHYSVTVNAAADTHDSTGQLLVKLTGNWGTTDFVSVTEEKENLRSNHTYGGVFVASTEVGIIQSLTLRYNKASGFLWIFGRGKDTFGVDTVHVVSGENGREYTFCLHEHQLKDATEVTLAVGSADEC